MASLNLTLAMHNPVSHPLIDSGAFDKRRLSKTPKAWNARGLEERPCGCGAENLGEPDGSRWNHNSSLVGWCWVFGVCPQKGTKMLPQHLWVSSFSHRLLGKFTVEKSRPISVPLLGWQDPPISGARQVPHIFVLVRLLIYGQMRTF